MIEFLSDIEDCNREGRCLCGRESFYSIETDGWHGKHWAYYCRPCGDRKLDALAADAKEEARLDAEAAERLGYDPAAFCDHCGVKYNSTQGAYGCRCEADHWREVEPIVGAEIPLRTAGEIALLIESEGGRA